MWLHQILRVLNICYNESCFQNRMGLLSAVLIDREARAQISMFTYFVQCRSSLCLLEGWTFPSL